MLLLARDKPVCEFSPALSLTVEKQYSAIQFRCPAGEIYLAAKITQQNIKYRKKKQTKMYTLDY